LFTREIERALLDNEIDCAVHSLKDLPTELPEGLEIVAFSVREDVRDALIAQDGMKLLELPKGSTVATGSLRRPLTTDASQERPQPGGDPRKSEYTPKETA